MIKYDCYFDASFTPRMSRGGFCILNGNNLEKQSVRTLGAKTSDMAEAEILHKLLDYIGQKIEHGNQICIYGDSQNVILSILRGNKGCKRYKSLRRKFNRLGERYDLSIEFVPRERNTRADALARYGFMGTDGRIKGD